MADRQKIREAAARGFLGHAALLDPDAHAAQYPEDPKPSARSAGDTNEMGLIDRLKTPITSERIVSDNVINIRSDRRRKANEAMMAQGKSMEDIQADELANPMN